MVHRQAHASFSVLLHRCSLFPFSKSTRTCRPGSPVEPGMNRRISKKNISPSLTMPLPTSRTVCDLYFTVHFIFHIANYSLCILYRVFLLYPRPTAHFYMHICRILLIQLLGCHTEINACLVNRVQLRYFLLN